MASTVRAPARRTEGEKFKRLFRFLGSAAKMPSHRILALFRGEKEEILEPHHRAGGRSGRRCRPAALRALRIMRALRSPIRGAKGDKWLAETVRWAWRTKIQITSQRSICGCGCGTAAEKKRCACSPPICATCCSPRRPAPAPTMGLDPGFRTGVKVAVSMPPARWWRTTAIYPHEPQRRWDESLGHPRQAGAIEHGVELIAIGNGTASRETDKLATELVKRLPERKMTKIVVSEAGASVYSASALPRANCLIST
jgi:uncharacterized protein